MKLMRLSPTFYRVPLSPFSLRYQFFLLFFSPLQFLYPLVMVEHCNTHDLLRSILPHHELI